MNVTIVQLRSFILVAEELHFGRAAAALQLSPSAVSEHIAVLERNLRRQLFERSSRSVKLTGDGSQLLPLARKAVSAMDEVLDWSRIDEEGIELKVGLMVSSPGFQNILSVAARRMGSVKWEIRQLGFLGCYDALSDGEVDCVFVSEISEVPFDDIEGLPLWDEQCMLMVSEGHPFAGRRSLVLADLEDETFVTVANTEYSARWLSAMMPKREGGHRVVPAAHSFEEVIELCAAGLGVNICGESAALVYSRPGVCFVPISDAPSTTTYLCLRQGRRPAVVEEFARLAVETAHAPR